MTEEELEILRKKARREWKRAERDAKKPLSKEEEEERKEIYARWEAESWGMIYGAKEAIKKRNELEKSKDTGTTK